jgi:hypothetical protein
VKPFYLEARGDVTGKIYFLLRLAQSKAIKISNSIGKDFI